MDLRLPQYQQDTWSKPEMFSVKPTEPSSGQPVLPLTAGRATTFGSDPGFDGYQNRLNTSRNRDSLKFFAQDSCKIVPPYTVIPLPPPPSSGNCFTTSNKHFLTPPVATINPTASARTNSKTPNYIPKSNFTPSMLRHRTSLPALITSALPAIQAPGTFSLYSPSSASLSSSPHKPKEYALVKEGGVSSFRSADSSPRQAHQLTNLTTARYQPQTLSPHKYTPNNRGYIDQPNDYLSNNSSYHEINLLNVNLEKPTTTLKAASNHMGDSNPWSYAQTPTDPFSVTNPNYYLEESVVGTPLKSNLSPTKGQSAQEGFTDDLGHKLFCDNHISNVEYVAIASSAESFFTYDTAISAPSPAPTFRTITNGTEFGKPLINKQPKGRRATPGGSYMSPLTGLTLQMTSTYHLCNPKFTYETSKNPKRVLTKPNKAMHNNGFDNEDNDYILYVNDILGDSSHKRYLVLDSLGKGTFGQVVKCQNLKTRELVAVKVIKNRPSFLNQSKMEISILDYINNNLDKENEHYILRLKDRFMHKNHLCLVFELLSSNLYELIKQNEYRGLSLSLIRVFCKQLLDALKVLNEASLIHCDLKPENILLKSLETPIIKIIDFGSACHEQQTIYTYIQSRFYRAPEILLGIPYNTSIDMWSLGCIIAELFLGLPIFPGSSEYDQLSRIIETNGVPPNWMIERGKNSFNFFTKDDTEQRYRLKSLEEYTKEQNVEESVSKKYLASTDLKENIMNYPLPKTKMGKLEIEQEMKNRELLTSFIQGLLNYNPLERWTPQQALSHPFITEELPRNNKPLNEPLIANHFDLGPNSRDNVNGVTIKHSTSSYKTSRDYFINRGSCIDDDSPELYDATSAYHAKSNQRKNTYDDIKTYDINSKMEFNLKL